MKKIAVLMLLFGFMISCASTHSQNPQASLTPLNDRYGKPSVSPTAKKALKGDLAENKENEVVCKKVVRTGTRISTITCKTVAEHRNDTRRSKEAADRMVNEINKFVPKREGVQ